MERFDGAYYDRGVLVLRWRTEVHAMSMGEEATKALRELEADLVRPTSGPREAIDLADRILAVRRLLAKEEPRWVGTKEAKRLLAFDSEKWVKGWIQSGLLRSRHL